MKILRRPQVEEQTGLKRSHIYALMAEGRFPKPVPLGPKARGWLSEEIAGWVEQRVAERDAQGVSQ
jgi:prophage regulatory protein